jgi:ubiquinone/menaquinone biosynthesis C-methylase UbiE
MEFPMDAMDNLKSYDKYKRSSYESYNFKMPKIYDDLFWTKIFKVDAWDQEVLSQLGDSLSSIRILDVGCATGRLLCRLAKAGVKNLCGTDLAANILDIAGKKLSSLNVKADLRVADAEEELPWSDDMFDFVTLTGVFHHFYQPQKALGEIHRVLKTGGRLILIEPWFPPVIRQILNFYLLFFPHDGDCHFFSPKGLIKLLQSNHLSKLQLIRVAKIAYMIVSEKKSIS